MMRLGWLLLTRRPTTTIIIRTTTTTRPQQQLRRRPVVIGLKRLSTSSIAAADDDDIAGEHQQRRRRNELNILGSGSIGLFLAGAMRAKLHDYPLRLLLRDHHSQNILQQQHQQQVQPIHGSPSSSNQHYINISIHQPSSSLGGENRKLDSIVPVSLLSSLSSQTTATKTKIRTLVLTTKAFQAVDALRSIENQLESNCRIIVLCNGGLAVREELEREFLASQKKKNWNIELASITHGVYRAAAATTTTTPTTNNDDGPTNTTYSLVHAGVGKVFLVSPESSSSRRQQQQKQSAQPTPNDEDDDSDDEEDTIMDLDLPSKLNKADLNCHVVTKSQMEDILWYKLAANCVCNPITALYQCTNGEMYQHVDDMDHVIHQVVQEVCSVQRAIIMNQLHEQEEQPTNHHHLRPPNPKIQLQPDQVTQFVHQVIKDNWNNRTSMQQDAFHQRPLTEIDYLNGYIVKSGNTYGIECPVNRKLQQQILDLQDRYYISI